MGGGPKYKNDLHARCFSTVEAAFGTDAAKTLCFRCKGTKTVCNGAMQCCFDKEVYLANTTKPCAQAAEVKRKLIEAGRVTATGKRKLGGGGVVVTRMARPRLGCAPTVRAA